MFAISKFVLLFVCTSIVACTLCAGSFTENQSMHIGSSFTSIKTESSFGIDLTVHLCSYIVAIMQ